MRKYIVMIGLIFFLLLVSGCNNNSISKENDLIVNDNLFSQSTFSVSSDSTDFNSSAEGTVFVREVEGGSKEVQIIASIEIDPKDWGGVAFYFSSDWNILKITSSYPENEPQVIAADYIGIWTTAEAGSKWGKRIEVARNRDYRSTIGGTGTIVIDLVLDEKLETEPETFDLMVTVGSDEKDNIKIVETDNTQISISLKE